MPSHGAPVRRVERRHRRVHCPLRIIDWDRTMKFTFLTALLLVPLASLHAAEPKTGESKRVDLGGGFTLEVVDLPPGEFMMGSTPEEKAWATGIEGGARPG